jgi:hypothetical protein
MVLFSRSFVRKRLISLATTASVAATSFALAEDPTKTDFDRGARPIHHVASRPKLSQERPLPPENDGVMNSMMADIAVRSADDADRDLISMIVPRQKSAIDMGQGRPAQETVATQQRSIFPMRKAASEGYRPRRSSRSKPARKWRRNRSGLMTRAPVAERGCFNSLPSAPPSQAALQG